VADYRTMFSTGFLRAIDLDGEARIFTIEKVEPGTVGEDDEEKDQPVITFKGIKKQFGCNRTNADFIAGMYGIDTTRWVNRQVTLYPTKTKFKGEMVACIRVEPTPPKGGKRAAADAAPAKGKASEAKRIRELEAELAKAKKKGARR
jgi:hypothetical protein